MMLRSEQRQTRGRAAPTRRSSPRAISDAANPVWRHLATASPQARITVGEADDHHEREADRVAEAVVSMPGHSTTPVAVRGEGRIPGVQRMCSECEEELRRQPLEEEEEPEETPAINAKHEIGAQTGGRALPPRAAARIESFRGRGSALSEADRAYFEPRFGSDFSGVRIHTGAEAADAAGAVQARAFTVGDDIVFGRGHYQPGSQEGRRLIAHELTHVLQRRRGAVSRDRIQRTVYMCSKDLDTSPVGTHAFFRIGGSDVGNPTLSLQPVDQGDDCWQGIPDRNYPSDYNTTGVCAATGITRSCLESQFAAYPRGRYCTWGPNSNTFVGHVARQCGLSNPDPAGWNPGIDASPPTSGTYAPSKWATLVLCTSKPCERGPDGRTRSGARCEPRYMGGGAYLGRDCIVRQGPGPKI
jgi:hypothetical protein